MAVRRELRARLRELTPSARASASVSLCHHLADRLPIQKGQLVAGFLPLPTEPDLTPFYRSIEACGGRIAFPVVTGPGCMEFRVPPARVVGKEFGDTAPGPASCLRQGPHSLMEPDPQRCPLAEPGDITLALVPGLGFSPDGDRLGHGAGYYDRWLATVPGAGTVGVAFACQLLSVIPCDPHDRRVHHVVTELGWTTGTRPMPDCRR